MDAKLALVRHGETDWNAQGRLQGQTDIPLNDVGRGQARAAGQELARTADDAGAWHVVVSSPLVRARESAELIAEVLGLPLRPPVESLVERHYGDGEGRIVAGLPRHDLDRLLGTAEPEDAVAQRGIATLARLARTHAGQNLVVVAHGTLIRLTLDAILGERHPHIHNGQAMLLDAAVLAEYAGEPDAAAL